MKILLFGLIALFLTSCNENSEKKFTLSGETVSVNEGTVLYLMNRMNGDIIDSTKIENNHFYFQTKLPKAPLHALLRTSYQSNSTVKQLWLENNAMTFDATKTDFRNALVTGSESENLSQELSKRMDTLFTFEEMENAQTEFVNNYPSSPVSSYILSMYSKDWGKEKTQKLFNKLSPENKTSEYGRRIGRYIKINMDLKIGEQFEDFEMTDTNGNIKKLSDLKGKIIILEFWASWCKPCRQENPNLIKVYEKYKSKGLEIFAVSLDTNKDNWLNAIKKDSINWIHVSDLKETENKAAVIYGVNSIPDNFLIDENGVLIGRRLQGDKLNEMLVKVMPVANNAYNK